LFVGALSSSLLLATALTPLNAAEMTNELEHNIGRDLQFIRVNGTLVGGLVGLAIYTATQVAHHLR